MFKNYFKIAFRNLYKNKGFSILNISGLAVGMASAMLILLWVRNELRYDNFYSNNDRLYQVWNRDKGNNGLNCWNNTTKPLAPALKSAFPEIDQTSRVNWNSSILFNFENKKMNVTGTMVDPDFLTMFGLPFVQGNNRTALNNPNDIVITESLSKKLFGSEDPMGKTVLLDTKHNFTVSGLIRDFPNNSQFNFEFLLPWSYMRTIDQDDSSWGNNSTHTFVLLKPHIYISAVNAHIRKFVASHIGEKSTNEIFLYPVNRLHLYGNFENGIETGGLMERVKIFLIIAAFILLIACINFMNMSTARSEKRAREVGIRKVSGALRKALISQFLLESILIALIAGIISIILLQLSLPAFNRLVFEDLRIELNHVYFWIAFVGFILFTGLLAGSYPAFFLSSFRPVAVLKGTFQKVNALITPRKILVVLQFTFAIILIEGTMIVWKQIQYAQERESGYDKRDLVYIPLSGDIEKNLSLIKNDLIGKGIAESISKTSAPITEGWSSGGGDWPGKDPNDRTEINYYDSDGDLVKTTGMQLTEGRDLDVHKYPTDSTGVVLNESAVKLMKFKNPLGQLINRGRWDTIWHVVGVVKDFILQSPYEPIRPIVIQGPHASWYNVVHVKLSAKNSTASNIAALEKVFNQYNPKYPFEYHFIDQQYAQKFGDEQVVGTLSAFFAGLTIFISCLGLFGLAAYMAQNRIKEIGVRKVLGASVTSITSLLSRDFIRLVVIAILIASPLAWYAMNQWLSGYNYRIQIPWWIFLGSGMVSIVIALFTVGFQAIKAAMANPVTSLRSE
jgi:ABC-type antimicrobial peptide transport system permease subunit